MPSERFYNLKSVKRRTFLKMAYKEFALHSYEGASITRLVGDLKMAKGSIYQYFEDKEDLYNYLIEHAADQLVELFDKTCPLPQSDDDLNKWLEKALLIQVKFLLAIPSYALLFNKNKADFGGINALSLINKKIEIAIKVTGEKVSIEYFYLVQNLPLIIFNYIAYTDKIELDKIINSDSSIDVPTDKLLYLCEAFLQKS